MGQHGLGSDGAGEKTGQAIVSFAPVRQFRGVNLHVTCVGHGPRWGEAKRAAQRAGLDDTVRFVGEVPAATVERIATSMQQN